MLRKNLFKSFLVAIAALSIISCQKTPPIEPFDFEQKVLILNQGNFTEHSASISLYDEVTGEIQNRIYESANGVSIGATIVSGSIASMDEVFLVCNNPDKIDVIDCKSAKLKGTPITEGLESPRYILVGNNRIFVSNWGYEYTELPSGFWEFDKSFVAIYDRATRELVSKTEVGTDAEGMVVMGNRLYIAVKEGVKVFTIVNDNLIHERTILPNGFYGGAKHFVLDHSYNIWASFPEKGVVQIDPVTLEVLKIVDVPIDFMDGNIAINSIGTTIYTYNTEFDSNYAPVESNIYSVDTNTGVVEKFFSGNYFYGVAMSPFTGDIFASEVSFTSNSLVKIIGANKELKKSVTAGVGTFRFLFF